MGGFNLIAPPYMRCPADDDGKQDGRAPGQPTARDTEMTSFVNELMSRNVRRSDEPDTVNRAKALREVALADGRAWMIAWLMGRHAY